MKKYQNRIAEFFCLGLLATFGILMIVCGQKGQGKDETQMPVVNVPEKTIFKTIPDSQNAIGLIGFELHRDGDYSDGYTSCPVFNAVVKNLDPAKDDYRSLCKDVVTDVINSYGHKEVIVNVFDSFEAYKLNMDFENGMKMLTAEETLYINEHKVATYVFTSEYNNESYDLLYYPDAGSRYSAHESLAL